MPTQEHIEAVECNNGIGKPCLLKQYLVKALLFLYCYSLLSAIQFNELINHFQNGVSLVILHGMLRLSKQ
jgi:hypothetical protein